VKFSEMRMKCM